MNTTFRDLRYGARMLLRQPGFTVIAVLTLALGIGANTAIFSLIDAVLLKSLPVKDPQQLVSLSTNAANFSYPLLQDLRDQNQVFAGVVGHSLESFNFSANSQTERASGEMVSSNFFAVLGVNPYLGRFFSDSDDKTPGAQAEAIVSHGFWTRSLGADPALIGKTVHLNSYPFTVVGISPPSFFGVEVGASPDIWIPITMRAQLSPGSNDLRMRNKFWVRIMARLKPDVTEQQAQSATDALFQQINQGAPGQSAGLRDFLSKQHIQLQPASKGLSSLRKQFKQPLLILMGIVGLILLIACANVANLLLARGTARRREIAVRLALGAGRFRLVRQLLTESLLLSLLGSLLGLLLAFWATDLLLSLMSNARLTLEINPDFRVLGFNAGVAVVAGILFGLAPALQATRPDLITALKSGIPGFVRGRRFELRKLLVVSQVALSLLLLIAAGLFVRTLQNLNGIEIGFTADKVLLMSVNPRLNGYSSDQSREFYGQLLERVKNVPGVLSASVADMPLFGGAWIDGISVEGYKPAANEDMSTSAKNVEPGFFETMGIPLLVGRDFGDQDGPQAPRVAIINETVARDFFSNQNPIGRRIGVGDKPNCEIIGVIKDTKYRNIKEPVPRTVYVPLAQSSMPIGERTLHVRTAGDPTALIGALRHEVRNLDSELPVYNVKTFSELLASSLSQERLIATLSSFFGLLAMLLAAIGLYGVMAYSVASRTREIGVRMALGARRRDVIALVLGQGITLVLIGAALGLVAAVAFTRVTSGLLYGVSTTDPVTFLLMAALLTAVALMACYLPARRATKVDPMIALRYE